MTMKGKKCIPNVVHVLTFYGNYVILVSVNRFFIRVKLPEFLFILSLHGDGM